MSSARGTGADDIDQVMSLDTGFDDVTGLTRLS